MHWVGLTDGTSIMEQWKAQPDWNEPDARDCSFLAARIITGGSKYTSHMRKGMGRGGGRGGGVGRRIYLLIPLQAIKHK